MAGAAAGLPAVVRVVGEIKNAVGTCGFASPPEVDLRLGITADDRYVFVQCALLNLKAQANKALEAKQAKTCCRSSASAPSLLSAGQGQPMLRQRARCDISARC